MVTSYKQKAILGLLLVILSLLVSSIMSEPASSSLYNNYAKQGYSREFIREEQTSYFDLFGVHITDGNRIYNFFSNRNDRYNHHNLDTIPDARNQQDRHSFFWQRFNNLILGEDQVGDSKMLLLVGDQIQTKFTPFTFNKRYFSGIRWDVWSTQMKFTALLSRTRPGIMSKGFGGGTSYIAYPVIEKLTQSGDWSRKTFFGDYDFLWGIHAENTLANKVNVGVTYLNHHHSDIEQGEKILKGEFPKGFTPEEIHFELYDLTPDLTDDDGVKLENITMFINNQKAGSWDQLYEASPTRYLSKPKNGFYLNSYHLVQNDSIRVKSGPGAIIATFYPREAALNATPPIDTTSIKSIRFLITVSGNYLLFVSNENLTVQDDAHFITRTVNKNVEYVEPFQRTVADVERELKKITIDKSTTPPETTFVYSPVDGLKSEAYFGEYIAQSPKKVRGYTNTKTITYEYNLPLGTETFSVNFNGKLAGIDFGGEYVATNVEDKLPFQKGERTTMQKRAGFFKVSKNFMDVVTLRGDLYNIDADFQPGMRNFAPSIVLGERFQQDTRPLAVNDSSELDHGYLTYTKVMHNDYSFIDDNEDDDFYAEGDRRQYPSEFAANKTGNFHNDGTLKPYIKPTDKTPGFVQEKRVLLPTGLERPYEDIDGVIPIRLDRNENGIIDYREDFLLYQADPPIFFLDEDFNNNGIFDVEEDDLYPDYPYSMGYVYTANSFKSLGIRGFHGISELTPFKDVSVKFGYVTEQILDPDMDGYEESLPDGEGKNQSIYLRAKYQVIKRALGIKYFVGQELKQIKDGIRNDVVVTHPSPSSVKREVNYSIKTDPLKFRNALVSNTAISGAYSNISRFEIAAKLAFGYQKLNSLPGTFFVTQTLDNKFLSAYVPYRDKNVGSVHALIKMNYDIKFIHDYSGRLEFLNVLQNLVIQPQFKLMYIKRASDEFDPRLKTNFELSNDKQGSLFEWLEYVDNNEDNILSVPIIRFSYKLGEFSRFESGVQWKREYNILIPEDSFKKFTFNAQIISQVAVQGYDMALLFGYSQDRLEYESFFKHALFRYGSLQNIKNTGFFVKILAGI